MGNPASAPRRALRLSVYGLALLFLAGYVFYARFASAITGAASGPHVALSLLVGAAVLGGVASFFSPCSIVFAPSLLLTTGKEGGRTSPVGRALLVGIGILAFYGAAGTAVGVFGELAYPIMAWLIPIFGLLFLGLGALVLTGRGAFAGRFFSLRAASPVAPDRPLPLVGYGLVYGAAAHGCSLPIFLGILLTPLAAGDPSMTVLVTLVYGAAMTLSLTGVAVWGRDFVMPTGGRLWGYRIHEAMGVLFLLMGGYLVVYFLRNAASLFH